MITRGLYRARFEKDKVVDVLRSSKTKVWFNYQESRYVYELEKFLMDFLTEGTEKEDK